MARIVSFGEDGVMQRERYGDNDLKMLVMLEYGHLPAELKYIGRSFYDLGLNVIRTVPDSMERVLALRSLVQAREGTISATEKLRLRQEGAVVLRELVEATNHRGPESERQRQVG